MEICGPRDYSLAGSNLPQTGQVFDYNYNMFGFFFLYVVLHVMLNLLYLFIIKIFLVPEEALQTAPGLSSDILYL